MTLLIGISTLLLDQPSEGSEVFRSCKYADAYMASKLIDVILF